MCPEERRGAVATQNIFCSWIQGTREGGISVKNFPMIFVRKESLEAGAFNCP